MKTFEESTPKPRRLSAPSRVVWRSIGDPCDGVRKLDLKRAIVLPKSSNDLVMDVDVESADSPRERVSGNKDQQVSLDGTVPGSQVYPDVVSKPLSMDVTLNSSSNDAVPTIPASSPMVVADGGSPDVADSVKAKDTRHIRTRRGLPPLILLPPLAANSSDLERDGAIGFLPSDSEMDIRPIAQRQCMSATVAPCSFAMDDPSNDVDHHQDSSLVALNPHDVDKKLVVFPQSLMSTSHSLPPLLETHRTLRRKQGMTVIRKKSSRLLRNRASISVLQRPESSRDEAGKRASIAFSTASDPRVHSDVRLGHPSRPYYTAIRKNMSPANSYLPASTILPTGRSSFTLSNRPVSNLSPADIAHTHPDPPVTLTRGMSVPSPFERGFSLSGEVELHMALARVRSRDSPREPQEFRFSETRRDVTVKGTVKKLGKGLKNLVLGRS